MIGCLDSDSVGCVVAVITQTLREVITDLAMLRLDLKFVVMCSNIFEEEILSAKFALNFLHNTVIL